VNDWQVVVDKPRHRWRVAVWHDGRCVDVLEAWTHDGAHRRGMRALRRLQADHRVEVVYDSRIQVSH
jgi:hypothetical protein